TYSESREITGLSITDDSGEIIFDWKLPNRGAGKKEADKKNPVKKQDGKVSSQKTGVEKASLTKNQLDGLETELKRTGVAMETVQERYHIDDPAQMSEELYNKVMRALSRTRSAA
ncbi:MAG: hypothetical protein K2I96_19570, partial [Lachnospiraceae bacterium]|nr:hypothetical protein [Lachnospiraceae bacterium]